MRVAFSSLREFLFLLLLVLLLCVYPQPTNQPTNQIPLLLRRADEEIFRKTRLTVSAIVAKVHTIDWTVELLKNPILRTAMRANWYGVIGEWASAAGQPASQPCVSRVSS